MTDRITRQSCGVLFCLLATAGGLYAQASNCSWPRFHGPNQDNISTETGLLKSWPPEGPPLLWTARGLGHGFSSVAVAAGIICTAGNIDDQTVITALDLNGELLWRAANGKAWKRDVPGTRSTPTIDGDRVYHQSPLGSIVCLEARSGRKVWELDILKKVHSKNSQWGLAESLLIDGDRLISCPGGPETSMVALDKKTGRILWKAPSTGELAGYSSPILVEHRGLRIIMTMTAKAFIGVNAETGSLLWHIRHISYADENVMMPIFRDGRAFISTLAAGSVQWRVIVENGKARLQELWRTKEMDNHHGGVVLLGDNLYGSSTVRNAKQWVCLDWRTGRTKSVQQGLGKGSLTCADGMLYTFSIDRLMGLARPTATGFELVSSFEIPEGGKGKSWAHPVVCGGRLYLRHGEFLYAYDIRPRPAK